MTALPVGVFWNMYHHCVVTLVVVDVLDVVDDDLILTRLMLMLEKGIPTLAVVDLMDIIPAVIRTFSLHIVLIVYLL